MNHDVEAEDAAPPGSSYVYRPSVMGGVCTFRAAPDALHWSIGRHSGVLDYKTIRRIRLSYRPVSLANYRFVAEIWADGLPKMIIASTTFKSIFEQGRQDADYLALIRALHERLRAHGAMPALETGSPPLIYWPGVLVCALMFAALPVVAWRTAQTGATGAALLVLAFALLCIWQVGGFFYRNRPGAYAADALPMQVLPKGQ